MKRFQVLFAFLLALLPVELYAQADPLASSFDKSIQVIETFNNAMGPLIQQTVEGSIYNTMAFNLFVFFSAILIIFTMIDFINLQNKIGDVVKAFTFVAFIGAIMLNYLTVINVARSFTLGLGAYTQQGLLGNEDPAYPIIYMVEVFDRIKFHWGQPDDLFDVASWVIRNIISMILGLILFFVNFAMVVINAIATLWSTWGFAILSLVGLMFLPFALSKEFYFLFQGWLRVFVLTLLFGTFARISTSLSIVGFATLLGIPTVGGFEGKVWVLGAGSIWTPFALIVFGFMSVIGIRSCFLFANGVVSGMGSGLAKSS